MTMYESSNPISVSRTIDKLFSESQFTGELLLTGRKLKTLPSNLQRFNLVDLHTAGKYMELFFCLVVSTNIYLNKYCFPVEFKL